jgi:hypothetical protein
LGGAAQLILSSYDGIAGSALFALSDKNDAGAVGDKFGFDNGANFIRLMSDNHHDPSRI